MQKQQSLPDLTLSPRKTIKKGDIWDDRFLQRKTLLMKTHKKGEKRQREGEKSSSYESYLSDTMLCQDEDQSIRNFTLNKSNQKENRTSYGIKMNLLRTEKTTPFRKFKVSGWKDNFYTNLLDWSNSNFICAGYVNNIFLYNMAIDDEYQSSLHRKFSVGVPGQYLTALKSGPFQTKIALGFSGGTFRLYDYYKEKVIYSGSLHLQRIGTIQWSSERIITGSKDQYLRSFDARTKKMCELAYNIQKVHTQQICGVKQRNHLLSSGGNDNKVFIYDIRKNQVLFSYEHGAAVKAMTWISEKCLATGGGTADKKVKFWGSSGDVYREIDTGSQVCSLSWSTNTDELVSCQGFSLNQIIIWNKKGQRNYTFHGHSSRVLYSAISPNGEYLASGAGDQCLKIWKLFPGKVKQETLLKEQLR